METQIKTLLKDDNKKLYIYHGDDKYPTVIMDKREDDLNIKKFTKLKEYTEYLLDSYKKNSNKIYFISYGDNKFINSINRIRKEAESLDFFDKVYCFTEKDFGTDFIEKHGKFVKQNSRGGGYWIWKPYFIKRILEEMNNDDIIVYVDAGSQLNIEGLERLKEYLDIVKESKYGSLAFELPYIEKNWTKSDIFVHFNVLKDKRITHSWQLMATAFILRKCEHTIKMVNDWYDVMSNYELINDSPSIEKNFRDFIENRHDQSIFSIIRKINGTEIITDETCFPFLWDKYINYPIHAKRLRF